MIGVHGIWTPGKARREARVLLGRIAQRDNPAEQRERDHRASTVKEPCECYMADAEAGLKTRRRGRAIVSGGIGTGRRTVAFLGALLTYAREAGIIETNPAHGIRKAADQKRTRRLSEDEYRLLGKLLAKALADDQLRTSAKITRLLALTGCRRGEILNLTWSEVDTANSCLRLHDTKEGASVRPIGLPAVDMLEADRPREAVGPVFRGFLDGKPLIGFPKHWDKMFAKTPLADVTPHVLRHSFASIANDLGFTESTVAALLGHAQGSVTSRYIHAVDTSLIMAADTVAGYIQALLEGAQFQRRGYALDRAYDAARNNLLDRVKARIARAAPLLKRADAAAPAATPALHV
jgi:integrase